MLTEEATLSPRDVAKYCHVSFRTVLRWIQRGDLPAYQLPGRGYNRILATDVLRFMQKHQFPLPAAFRPLVHRVLVVEDELRLARSMARVLEAAGFEVEIAGTGFEAGMLLATFHPIVMTLDLGMPELSGHDILEVSQENHQLDGVRVLVVSGQGDASIANALQLGASDYLEKPFENEMLVEKVRALTPSTNLESDDD